MGRRASSTATSCSTSTSITTSTTTVKDAKQHLHARPPLKAFKLWCLRKCSRSSAAASPPPSHGVTSEVVAIESQRQPAWMRDGALDAAIWGSLPDEVHEHILAFLPFPCLFRCATVCQRWRDIAQSAHVRLTRAAPTAAAPWPAYSPVRYTQTASGALHWSGFSTATNKWQPLPHLALPPSPGQPTLAGAGGLLVVYKPTCIFVCNPVTNHLRELPQPHQAWSRPDVLHMIPTSSSSYKIILAGTEAYSASKPQPSEVYDSDTNSWSVTGRLPADLYLDTQDAALESESGVLYCTAQKRMVGTDALVAYDVARGVWWEVAGHLPDESARQTPLVCGGRTVVAVAPVDDDGPVGCLYSLSNGRWELLASMPEELHRRVRSWGVCSVVGGDVIVVVSDSAQGCVVAYDVARGTWSERIKFGKSKLKDVRSLAPVSFRPDVNALP